MYVLRLMIITWITAVNWLFLFILVKMMLSSLIGKNDTSYSCLSFVHFSCLANTLVISSSIVNRLVVQLFRPFLFLHTYKSVQWFLCVNINAKTKYLLFFNLIFFSLSNICWSIFHNSVYRPIFFNFYSIMCYKIYYILFNNFPKVSFGLFSVFPSWGQCCSVHPYICCLVYINGFSSVYS